RQVLTAVEEADLVLLVVDAREGATALDIEIARVLRRTGRPVVLAANKVEGPAQEAGLADLYRLGAGEPVAISAEHGRGVAELLERCQVALVVLAASEGITAQDAHIAGYADQAGRATALVVNKWDLVPRGLVRKAEVVEQLRDRLPFLEHTPVCFTSAVRGEGVPELFDTIDKVAAEFGRRVGPAEVT